MLIQNRIINIYIYILKEKNKNSDLSSQSRVTRKKTHNNIILNLLKKLKETFKYKVNIVF